MGVDIGGTFTDVVVMGPHGGDLRHLKFLSSRTDPGSAIVEAFAGLSNNGVSPSDVGLLLHGTTVITNAIIARELAPTALVTTDGFRDVLEIGRHWRQELYDPFMTPPEPLVTRSFRFEVPERMDARGNELQPLDRKQAARVIEELRSAGIEAVAVVFLHSYRNPAHEQEMAALLREKDNWVICCSSDLSREIREVERTSTTVLNAALVPLAERYISKLESRLENAGADCHLYITQSNGGALPKQIARQRPVALALSGPVAGVVACCNIGRATGQRSIISLDMGGTSTDVAVISNLEPRYTTELNIGGLPVRLPSIQIHSIGAGGGSIASVDPNGGLKVGPESAGSQPGPACYDRGGTRPTVTDCQLILGRLSENAALAGSIRLRNDLARRAVLGHLAKPLGLSIEAAAAGVIEVVNASMEGAVRVALRDHGDDPREFALVAFGGAGAMHAAELARKLEIKTVIVPPHPGTLSALGVLLSDIRLDFSRTEMHRSGEVGLAADFARNFDRLEAEARAEIDADDALRTLPARFERSCDVRYRGQAYEVNVPVTGGALSDRVLAAALAEFHHRHEQIYGFSNPRDTCEFVTFRLAVCIPLQRPLAKHGPSEAKASGNERKVFLPDLGFTPVSVRDRHTLSPGDRIKGPAIVHELDATTLIPDFAAATVDPHANVILSIDGNGRGRQLTDTSCRDAGRNG